ncbi:MAG TPA: M50 family metallopeptidase [Candidatus Paceibacterota bacterium]|jgi:regulator of sigma E protease|nr:M50 family metallopeptidase [Candidatus Paceibacterota bacterium]
MTILVVVVILVCLILVHEFGHFLAAKLFRVRVDEFGIGFPPRALLLGKLRETEYTLNWIPFGGFVRLYGEQEDSGQHGRGSFMDSPRWKQGVILIAGVAMNAIAAYALFAVALGTGVPAIVNQLQPNQHAELLVSEVLPGSPAEAAGIALGDQIVSMQDAEGSVPEALTPSAMVAFISDHAGQPLSVTYVHSGATTTATVIPANGVNTLNAAQPAIGIGLVLVANVALPPLQAMQEAIYTTRESFVLVGQGLWEIVKTAAHGTPDLTGVVGPVGLVSQVGQAEQNGLGEVLELAAFISVNLTIVNLIPIPALDGGRLLVLLVEAIMRKSAPKLAVELLNTIGVALIILLMVTVTYNDIARLLFA